MTASVETMCCVCSAHYRIIDGAYVCQACQIQLRKSESEFKRLREQFAVAILSDVECKIFSAIDIATHAHNLATTCVTVWAELDGKGEKP